MIYTNNLIQFAKQTLKIKGVQKKGATDFYYTGYTPAMGFRTMIPTEDKMVFLCKFWKKNEETDKNELKEEMVSLTWEAIEMEKADKSLYTAETYVIEFNWIKYPFYKTFKKVYDLKILLEQEQEVNKYKDKKTGEMVTEFGNEVLLENVWASKIAGIQEDVLELELEYDGEYRKKGSEEKFLSSLDWISFKFTVKWSGKWTTYIWKEASFKAKTSVEWKVETLEGDISVEDLPF